MNETSRHDAWSAGDSYECYMGRWSRPVAARFLDWLEPAPDRDWVDVGCGSGALASAIIDHCRPARVTGFDPSAEFVETARTRISDPRAHFMVSDAQAIELADDSTDYTVSALVLNFVPDTHKALAEMRRVTRAGGVVAFYVWDYPGGGVEFMHAFWQAAVELDPAAAELAEDRRFPDCTGRALATLATESGLLDVESCALEAPAVFESFEDFWHPFTLGAGPAPGYCVNLEEAPRQALRERLEQRVVAEPDGSIRMKVRAWGVRARVPD